MIHIIPTLEDNYTYAVITNNTAILIDCGEAAPVLDFLKKNDISAKYLLCTHHHGDHIAGISELKNTYPDMEVYAPLKDMARIENVTKGLSDGNILNLLGIDFTCIETPGHTLNHLCFYSKELGAVFTGDTLFSLGCGRLFEGTPEQMFVSLQKLKNLPDETLIYCGHEYTRKNAEFSLSVEPENADIDHKMKKLSEISLPVTLALEKELNLFLKAETPKKFAQLRQLRDKF